MMMAVSTDVEHCPTCGLDVSAEDTKSYSLVAWDGRRNVLVQMYCWDHAPVRRLTDASVMAIVESLRAQRR